MAKKKINQKTTVNTATVNKNPIHSNKQPLKQQTSQNIEKQSFVRQYAHLLVIPLLAIIVFVVLQTCLNNQFTNWDDPGYIKDNALIKDITAEGIKNIFSKAIMGNYHPLTILSYGIEYSKVRLEPFLYHIDSLIIHILAMLAFYWFIYLLTRKTIVAVVTALLFGLHPMHVESVAWVAARKDVLYGMFYAGSCIFYLYYLQLSSTKRWGSYLLSLILFICSILSKPVAVSLPITLFLIDYFKGRAFLGAKQISGSALISNGSIFSPIIYLEKIPFLLISIMFGIRSLTDQRAFKALNTLDVHYNAIERISLGAYAFISYLWKLLVPVGLSNFYPYPEKVKDSLPFIYFLYPLLLVLLVFFIWKFARKNRAIIFGCLFFIVNIALLLQFIPVGGAILADRYSYVPYVGLFFMIGWIISALLEQNKTVVYGKIALGAIVVYISVLGYMSNQRCMVWYDTLSLWRDEVEKHPDVPSAFNNLGFEYFNRGNVLPEGKTRNQYFDSANNLLGEAIRLQPSFVLPYISLGEVARTRGDLQSAKTYYYKAVELSRKDNLHEGTQNAYLGLAIYYCITGQQVASSGLNPAPYYDSAQFCFRSALYVKPYFPEAHSNYGNFFDMMHNFDSSLKEYSISIAQNPDMYASYLNRARLLQRHNKCDEAFKDFAKAIEVSPDIGEIYYGRSYCFMQKGDKSHALQDVEKAISLGFTQIDGAYYKALKVP